MNNQYTRKVWRTLEEWDEDCGGNWEALAKVVRKWKRKYKKFGDKLKITTGSDEDGMSWLWCGYCIIHHHCDAHVELYKQQKKTEEQERSALMNSPQRQAIRRMIEEYKRQRDAGDIDVALLRQLKEAKNADV